MRVLWFTNDPMPAVKRRLGQQTSGTGHWMPSLLESLARVPGMQIEIATAYPGLQDEQFEQDGVKYFVIGQPKWPYMFFRCRRRDLERCVELVRGRAPDVVHIHGTERFFGLMPARRLIATPCVISLQGLLGPYLAAFFGALSAADLWRSHRVVELATLRGLLGLRRAFGWGARQEQEILAGPALFLGRTDWDRAHLRSVNSKAKYYHVGEVLRRPFGERCWEVSQCDRHTVIFTNAGEPRRGTEVLLKAMRIVRDEFPDAKLRLAGQIGTRRGYERFLRRTIAESGPAGTVELLGYLDAGAMARELCRAHVFAISSYAENSPNSLCEAMLIGVPCVAAYAGGIPSLVEHGRAALLFPPGDAALLADAILRIFRDDPLAGRLSRAARATALERHGPQRVVTQLVNAYHMAAVGQVAHDAQAISAFSRDDAVPVSSVLEAQSSAHPATE